LLAKAIAPAPGDIGNDDTVKEGNEGGAEKCGLTALVRNISRQFEIESDTIWNRSFGRSVTGPPSIASMPLTAIDTLTEPVTVNVNPVPPATVLAAGSVTTYCDPLPASKIISPTCEVASVALAVITLSGPTEIPFPTGYEDVP
jgi:hypothetical protein